MKSTVYLVVFIPAAVGDQDNNDGDDNDAMTFMRKFFMMLIGRCESYIWKFSITLSPLYVYMTCLC